MPNPQMRDARQAALAKPLRPTPALATDSGPQAPLQGKHVHAALKAQNAIAESPRPVAQASIGERPADLEAPNQDTRVTTAAKQLQNRADRINQAVDAATQ